ncbi:MAG TPA: ABC transporter substrate-binding protein [Actinomycetota bacterium]|nr:ABC transporter substrate-binding protein [Actinomycetota bacterium]
MRRSTRLLAFLFTFVLLAAACGQKPGVHTRGRGTLVGGAAEEGLGTTEAGGELAAGQSGSGSSSEGGSSGGTSSGSTGGTTGGSTGGTTGGAGDTTGVTPTVIRIGFHAPITGASAVALSDIRLGTDLLKDYLKAKGVTIHGRNTITYVKDDQYSPSHAVSVCRELVEQRKVFMLVGGGGTDQVQACARYASTKGVPYLSAGVTENVLKNLKNYFAFSATYPDQAKPLVSMLHDFVQPAIPGAFPGGPVMQDRCPGTEANAVPCDNPQTAAPRAQDRNARVAIVYSDTEGFYDARDAFLAEFQAKFGRKVDDVESITKFVISGSDANSKMLALKRKGVDVIYVLTSPTNWLELVNRANQQQFRPKWVGVGITKGLNIVAGTLGCARYPTAIHGSLFLSPWYSTRHDDAKQFGEAWKLAQDAGKADGRDYRAVDLAFGVWGGSIVQAALLHNAGKNLTRKGFISATEKVQNFKWTSNMGWDLKQVYPNVSYSPGNHFGSQQVHLLWAHCFNPGDAGYWDYFPGEGHFVSGF